nr:hypothetical protein [Tanacetum cinerariifolium]
MLLGPTAVTAETQFDLRPHMESPDWTEINTQFDLRPHMESPDWTEINVGIQQHLQKAYNTNKAAFKAQHWVIDPTTGTYNVEKIRNIARAAQNWQNQAKSTVISRQGSRSLARLRDEM